MPFPVIWFRRRTALERLGLERQWFAVIPLVETERLMKITRTETCCSPRPTTRWCMRSTPRPAGCSGRPSSGSERASPAESRPIRSRSS